MSPLQATFEAAQCFGLTDDEAWRVVEESLVETCGEALTCEYREELVVALAARILAKQRARGPSRSAGRATAR
jgi:hypothetical protein